MRKPLTNLLRISLGVALCLLLGASPVEAQFLKKLGNALEKVNKGLEKAEKTLKGETSNSSNNSGNSNSSNAGSKTSGTNPGGNTPAMTVDDSRWKPLEDKTSHVPFLSPNTFFMQVAPYDVSSVSDGVFGVQKNGKWEFWQVDGTKLYDANWWFCGDGGERWPHFVGGVAAARRDGEPKRICLLYLDGRVKECDPAWERVSDFVDGIALVESRKGYESTYFFINREGEKIYPNLKVSVSVFHDGIRPLRDGLRAYSQNSREWGFIDAKGNVKLAPTYRCARDFSEGYAWVGVSDGSRFGYTMKLIDTTGKVVFDAKTDKEANVSPVVNGRFFVKGDKSTTYYDLAGNKVGEYATGSTFYDGTAFVKPLGTGLFDDYNFEVVTPDFKPIAFVSNKILSDWFVMEGRFTFEPYGLAVNSQYDYILDPKGKVVIRSFNDYNGNQFGGFSQFTSSGYSLCKSCYIMNENCSVLMKPTGEIAWVFSDNNKVAGPYTGPYVPPIKPGPGPVDPPTEPSPEPPTPLPVSPGEDFTLRIVDVNIPARGPRVVEPVKFKVAVAANPSGGGTVSLAPGASVGYGEYATVTASPNKDWAVASVTTSDTNSFGVSLGKPFSVTADQTVTVNFVKKDDDKAPENTGDYQGTLKFQFNHNGGNYDIPVYARINADGNESSPYGENTYGYMVAMYDPNTRYTDGKTATTSFFAAPLKIWGVQKDAEGKQWLVLDGGAFTAGNVKLSSDADPLTSMMLNMMMGLDGFSNMTTQPRHYRLEMLDIDPQTGEFTCGVLQTYNAKSGGWVKGGDSSLKNTTRGFFGSYNESGYPADFFQGIRMTKSAPRNDVNWYPPENWAKNKNAYEQLIESMGAGYRNSRSDYGKMFGD